MISATLTTKLSAGAAWTSLVKEITEVASASELTFLLRKSASASYLANVTMKVKAHNWINLKLEEKTTTFLVNYLHQEVPGSKSKLSHHLQAHFPPSLVVLMTSLLRGLSPPALALGKNFLVMTGNPSSN